MAEHALHDFDSLALRDQFAAARMPQLMRCVTWRAVG
jgi:hypothetical protein